MASRRSRVVARILRPYQGLIYLLDSNVRTAAHACLLFCTPLCFPFWTLFVPRGEFRTVYRYDHFAPMSLLLQAPSANLCRGLAFEAAKAKYSQMRPTPSVHYSDKPFQFINVRLGYSTIRSTPPARLYTSLAFNCPFIIDSLVISGVWTTIRW
ncbi:hypothetical protein BJV74DRAFT_808738 [Russula compacta]|nr:hypothetical protein BJV74DRAFT_808738 [Russula compacta]